MKSLFPDMEKEIATDRLADRRERLQRAREWLRKRYGLEKYVMDHLTANGPTLEVNVSLSLSEISGGDVKQLCDVIGCMWAMWMVGKLWRKEFKNHPCNERCYTYGIRGIHTKLQ